MKIVSWNANGKFREKVRLFDPTTIDVLVVQECERTEVSEKSYREAGWDFHWIGDNKHKGLAVFVPKDRHFEILSWSIEGCRYFLPVNVGGHNIVAVWTKGGKSNSVRYAGQVSRFLDGYANRIEPGNTIFIGDFNSNTIWDKRHRKANHTNNDSRLNELGLRSLYHAQENEDQGKETKPTFYLYRKLDRPYHIDHAYLPEKFLKNASIEVGRVDDWLEHSDHMQLIIELRS